MDLKEITGGQARKKVFKDEEDFYLGNWKRRLSNETDFCIGIYQTKGMTDLVYDHYSEDGNPRPFGLFGDITYVEATGELYFRVTKPDPKGRIFLVVEGLPVDDYDCMVDIFDGYRDHKYPDGVNWVIAKAEDFKAQHNEIIHDQNHQQGLRAFQLLKFKTN